LYSGVVCLGDFALQWGPLGFLCIALSMLVADWRRPLWRFLFIAIPAFSAYLVWAGGDVLHLRFFVHVLPLLVLATLPGLELALETLRGPLARFGPRAAPALGAALVVALVTLNFLADGRARATADQFGPSYVVNNARNVRRADRPLGRWLHDHVPPGTRIAAWDIGAIGYESDLPLLDLFGLTDARFARLMHARATPAQMLAALRENPPEYIANYAANGRSRPTWLDGDGGWLARDYEPVSYWPDSPATGILLLKRRSAALAR
jgi:hypothetical protein